MLPFFRKIRFQLAQDNQFLKYSRYALGEIVLVVVGILIALQINNWNEERKADNQRRNYLRNLNEEFLFNKKELDRVMKLNDSNLKNAFTLSENMALTGGLIDEDECNLLIANCLLAEVQFRPSDGALNEILSAGQLSIFKTENLKKSLASWDGALLKVRFQEKEHQNFRLRALELVHDQGNIKDIYRLRFGKTVKTDISRFNRDNLGLLQNIEFDNQISSFYMTAVFLNRPYYSGLGEKIDEILDLISKELKT